MIIVTYKDSILTNTDYLKHQVEITRCTMRMQIEG